MTPHPARHLPRLLGPPSFPSSGPPRAPSSEDSDLNQQPHRSDISLSIEIHNGTGTPKCSLATIWLLMLPQGLELPSYILAALTATGGAIGFARTRSKPSLIAGTAVGLLCRLPPASQPRTGWAVGANTHVTHQTASAATALPTTSPTASS
jgi:hypothetical protein